MNTLTRRLIVTTIALGAPLAVAPLISVAQDDPKPAATKAAAGDEKKVELNDLEKAFEKTMTGAVLVGRASLTGKEDQMPKEDRYEITKVTKIGEDLWMFNARWGKLKVAIPFPVPVKWAGDTPVISLTKFAIPTVGTFSARVVIYEGQYAGTWDGGDHGGHVWGRIERADKPEPAPTEPAKKPE